MSLTLEVTEAQAPVLVVRPDNSQLVVIEDQRDALLVVEDCPVRVLTIEKVEERLEYTPPVELTLEIVPASPPSLQIFEGGISRIGRPVLEWQVDEFYPTMTVPSASFALSQTPSAGSLTVWVNGLRLVEGPTSDYSLIGSIITIQRKLKPGYVVAAQYQYN